MSDKPGSLRLADELIAPVGTQSTYSVMRQAAACLRRQHAEIESLKAECEALRATLSQVADIAHNGGWVESDWLTLFVAIRHLTRPYFDRSGTTDEIKARVRAAIDAAREAGK